MGRNFKFQAQDSFLESFFWEIWKMNLTFWKKGTFSKSKTNQYAFDGVKKHNSLKDCSQYEKN